MREEKDWKPGYLKEVTAIRRMIEWLKDNRQDIESGLVDYYAILSQALEFEDEAGKALVLGRGYLREREMGYRWSEGPNAAQAKWYSAAHISGKGQEHGTLVWVSDITRRGNV